MLIIVCTFIIIISSSISTSIYIDIKEDNFELTNVNDVINIKVAFYTDENEEYFYKYLSTKI